MPLHLLIYLLPLLSIISGHLAEWLAGFLVSLMIGAGGVFIQYRNHKLQALTLASEGEKHEDQQEIDEQRLELERKKQMEETLRFWMDQGKVYRDELILKNEELREARARIKILTEEGDAHRLLMDAAVARATIAEVALVRVREEYERVGKENANLTVLIAEQMS